jgi:hypothetical protein
MWVLLPQGSPFGYEPLFATIDIADADWKISFFALFVAKGRMRKIAFNLQ